MAIITCERHFRHRMVKYAMNHSVTETAIRFKVSRKTVHKWIRRYDGTLKSLEDLSHRPHTSPRAHTNVEIRNIKKRVKKHKWSDLLLAYQELVELDQYSRSYGSFKKIVSKLRSQRPSKRKKKRKLKPYQRAEYPGQKIQIDVKYVPSKCVVDGGKYYQFTAVDECSRWTFREMYNEKSSYSSADFINKLIRRAPFPIRMVQTDNGSEFTNRLVVIKSKHLSMFEKALLDYGIIYSRIQIATPRHNGKVERQHRTDNERFYSNLRMFSLEDGRKQLSVYQRRSNNHIKTCLDMRSPNQILKKYLHIMF